MKLNPLTKFITVIWYCVLLFLIENVFILAGLCMVPLFVSLRYFKLSRFILLFSLIIFVLNAVFIPGDLAYKITYSLRIMFRFLGIVVSGLLFSREDPNEFAHALMKIGLSYRYGMTMVLTFRLIPLFSSESMMIKKAQMARGVNLEGISSIVNLIKYTFIPWIHSALERADALTLSMEGRCFGMYRNRTFCKESSFTYTDGLWLIFLTVILIIVSLGVVLPSS